MEDRYGGCYSGGKWVAVSPAVGTRITDVEAVVQGNDMMASDFDIMRPQWAADGTHVGVGKTPNDALADLIAHLREAGINA